MYRKMWQRVKCWRLWKGVRFEVERTEEVDVAAKFEVKLKLEARVEIEVLSGESEVTSQSGLKWDKNSVRCRLP